MVEFEGFVGMEKEVPSPGLFEVGRHPVQAIASNERYYYNSIVNLIIVSLNLKIVIS